MGVVRSIPDLSEIEVGQTGPRLSKPECLLLAQSGHHNRRNRCPLSGVKRTLRFNDVTSANDPKSDIGGQGRVGQGDLRHLP
jgi:hypothetical protein